MDPLQKTMSELKSIINELTLKSAKVDLLKLENDDLRKELKDQTTSANFWREEYYTLKRKCQPYE